MTTKFLEILADQSNTTFKATSFVLAKLKFQRLLKKSPGHNEYGDVLLKSAKDIENEVEYDKYLSWLANPRGITGNRNPHPSCTGEVIPKVTERPEILKSSGDTVIIEKEQIKNMSNAVFIHLKQNPPFKKGALPALDEVEEKVFES